LWDSKKNLIPSMQRIERAQGKFTAQQRRAAQ
jgi:hypothetical protein